MNPPQSHALHLNLRQLDIFRAVAESGSIRSAARRVHLTQPAVTHAVRELERSVGAPLFARSVKGVVPTDVGVALLHRAQVLFNEVRRTEDEVAQVRDGTGGRLSLAFSSLAAQLLPGALADFRARRPGVTLDLHEITVPSADERWRQGGYDFAVISETGEPAADGLLREPLLERSLVVVARAGHPLARVRSLARLQQGTWLVPGYGRALLQRLFADQGLAPPTDVIACESIKLAFTLLYGTDVLSMMASDTLSSNEIGPGLVRLPLPGPVASLRISLLMRDAASLTPAARVFVECLRREAAVLKPAQRAPAFSSRRTIAA